MTQQILQLKTELAEARQNRASLADAYTAVMHRRDAEILAIDERYRAENHELFTDVESFTAQEAKTESELRAALVENFKATGEKTFDKQLSVRVTTKYQYDQGKAVEWCETNAPIAIKKVVDAKLFEPFAAQSTVDPVTKVETMALPFVTKVVAPSAVIAKDLSEEKAVTA